MTTQVEDLKAKLAIQEVELHQRNKDMEALIAKIGQQTEQLNQDKAIADAEEQRVYSTVHLSTLMSDIEGMLSEFSPIISFILNK